MKNKGKTKRLMWMTTAACAMMFLGMGVCLICGLRAARESIEESCKRDMEVVMEQLEKPYATRLNTSDELTETMERYLFSQGRREIDLAADGRFLSALNGKSVRDVLFVTTDGHYVSVSGRTGWQKMDRENSGRLTAGKTVSGYRSWNGEEAFFVVKPIEPFFVQGEPYDAIALAYTPGSVNGALSFCAYGGQANVCIIRRDGRAVYAADDVWDQDDIFLRYAGAEKASAQADIRVGQAGCRTLEAKKERVYLAYRPIGDTPYMVVCEAACALVQNVMEDYTALIARIAALIGAMLAAVAALLDVSIRRLIDANRKAADARQSELAQEKANRELKSVNAALRESVRRAENLREQVTNEQEKRSSLIRSVSRGIRTPLNAVLGLTTLMNMTKDGEDMKRFARQIQAQVQKVMAVLEDDREGRKPVDLGDCTQQAAGGAKRLEGVRVLLAEDGELNAEIIQKLLTDEGAACDRVADGLQALRRFEAAAAGTYDVILMDMQMPVMDGCEAARAIRASGRADAENIPIIAMTANSFDDVRERIFEAGMDGYLGKPVEPGKLACAVRAAKEGGASCM